MSEKIYKAMKNTGALNIAVGIVTEKTYKVMGLAGGANIAIGIISIVVGVTTGIILLVSGGKLLGAKKGLTF